MLPLYLKKLFTIFFSYLRARNPCVEVLNEGATSHTGYHTGHKDMISTGFWETAFP